MKNRFAKVFIWLGVGIGGALLALSLLVGTAFLSQDRLLGQAVYTRVLQTLVFLLGPDTTYIFVAESVAGDRIIERHRMDHFVSRVLYKQYGVQAFNYCDEERTRDTGYGCYHEIIGRSIIQSNSPVDQNELLQTCKESGLGWLVCEHSVGHGYTSYYGYTQAGLLDAVAACDVLVPSRGCHGGAYMEFLFRAMHEAEVDPLKLTPENAYTMCKQVSSEYAGPCYFWQAKWWLWWMMHSSKSSSLDTMKEAVAMCYEPSMPETAREACFAAVGHDTLSIERVPQELGLLCDELFETDLDGAHICRTYAARRLARITSENYIEACKLPDGSFVDSCVAQSAILSSVPEQAGFYDEF